MIGENRGMHLSLIIPAYNEEKRIADTLNKVLKYLRIQNYDYEIILVDDGSEDKTTELVEKEFPEVKIISYKSNRGKGHAVKTGMESANGNYRIFYDADASTPIEELEKFWQKFEEGAEVVIGSRALPESNIELHQPWYRETMGRTFNLFVKLFAIRDFPDTQCGFKGFTAEACKKIFPRQTINRFSFDAEILYIGKKLKFRIDQVPVRWINSPASRVNAITDSTRMLLDLISIRFKDFLGKYK